MRSGGATGGNLKSIIKQNLEIRAAQKKNGIRSSLIIFMVTKFLNRIKQSLKSNYSQSINNN